MDEMPYTRSEDWKVESEGVARVLGYSSAPVDLGLRVETFSADYRILVEGRYRLMAYRSGYEISSVAQPIIGVVMPCDVEGCSSRAVAYAAICKDVSCGCREWVCADHMRSPR